MSEIKPKPRLKSILSVLAVVGVILLVGIPLGAYQQTVTVGQPVTTSETTTQAFQDAINHITVGLTVQAFHSQNQTAIKMGLVKPFQTRYLPDDLLVDNFYKYLGANLYTGDSASSIASAFGTGFGGNCNAILTSTCGIIFEVGTSGTAPTRSDTTLNAGYTPSGGNIGFADTAQNPVLTNSPTAATCNTGATNNVNGISGSQVITGSVTIQEVGMFVSYANTLSTMVTHDTFTGVVVSNGDTMTVSYQINLSNAGLNNNFCNWMAGLFTGNIAAGGSNNGVSVSLTNTASASNNFFVWCNGSGNFNTPFYTDKACSLATALGEMGLGTSNAATSSSAVDLTSRVGVYQALSSNAYPAAGGVIYWTSTQTIGGSNTIQEASMNIRLSATTYMFFRGTFTGQSQIGGTPFGFTLRLGGT